MTYSISSKVQRLFKVSWEALLKCKLSARHMQTLENVIENPPTEVKLSFQNRLKELSWPYIEGYTCYIVQNCGICPGKKARSQIKSDIYINKRTGFFLCNNCKIMGNWEKFNELLEKHKDENQLASFKKDLAKINQSLSDLWNVVPDSKLLTELDDESIDKVLSDFKLPKVSKELLKKLQVRINKSQEVLYFPLCTTEQLVGFKSLDLSGSSKTSPRTDCPGYLVKSTSKKSAIIVATIHDFFALSSLKLPYDIICLPYGVSNLPQNTLPFFENYKKLILWLGEQSLNSLGSFANKLNEKRCFVVRPTEKEKSPLVALINGLDIRQIVDEAKCLSHDNIVRFEAIRDEVLSELQNKNLLAGVQWQRFPKLNKILQGHRRGELTVLTGATGVGKTTFMSEYSLDLAAQGVYTLWGSFEIKNSILVKTMLQQFARKPLSENIDEFNALADKFEELPIFFMTFHGQQDVTVVLDALEHCSYTYDIAHVIIDNIQFMIELADNKLRFDRFWKQDHLIQTFRNFATKNNCHVTLVMHPRKDVEEELNLYSIFGGAKAVQEADNVLILQKKSWGPNNDQKFLQVCKNRYFGDLGNVWLKFNKSNLSFSEWRSVEVSKRESFNDYRNEKDFQASFDEDFDGDAEHQVRF